MEPLRKRYCNPESIPKVEPPPKVEKPKSQQAFERFSESLAKAKGEIDDKRRIFAIALVDGNPKYDSDAHVTLCIQLGLTDDDVIADAKAYRLFKQFRKIETKIENLEKEVQEFRPTLDKLEADFEAKEAKRKRLEPVTRGDVSEEYRDAEYAANLARDKYYPLLEKNSELRRRIDSHLRAASMSRSGHDPHSQLPNTQNFILRPNANFDTVKAWE